MIERINKALRIVILILLILLALLSVHYKFDDCSKCSFKIDKENYNIDEFMGLYSKKCFQPEQLNLSIPIGLFPN